ncbi:hypothetical protein GCM10017600_64070 [Streptosporangium carneum]|uniref:Uncharacterized protein n=1 Tax=Streptosporangium carneum TaxID=47481 RepID=A0A9W6I780_9ACTN|nr:hypothetical protein GCM10017600_64070 [Streptosporangium carneum]
MSLAVSSLSVIWALEMAATIFVRLGLLEMAVTKGSLAMELKSPLPPLDRAEHAGPNGLDGPACGGF